MNLPDDWNGRFVGRGENGAITSASSHFEEGHAEEPLPIDDPELQAFLSRDIHSPSGRRLVSKSLIISRLNDVGLLAAASPAINANLYVRERWYAPDRPAIYADDAEALALLAAIGADPETILAPPEPPPS